MPQGSTKVFSLAEANQVVPVLAEFTAGIVDTLNEIRQRCRIDSEDTASKVPPSALKEIEQLLRKWSDKVSELGAHPKGYFTVDFQSIDPELFYCWSYGEEKISFTHKVWENFSHRRPLAAGLEPAQDHLKWVN
ncbi:MAG TPA: DUF2203 family protein [Acidobacteriota bacterium]|nr:DUF2203 family protein [Acidobacteriota bacterium]